MKVDLLELPLALTQEYETEVKVRCALLSLRWNFAQFGGYTIHHSLSGKPHLNTINQIRFFMRE